jgi:ArsR family transcriptional regulator, arsenate/arsenite/antimonite-responsive transcriptional repressor
MDNTVAVAALAALGFETRLNVVQLLATVGEQGLRAGELSRRLGVQQNTLSDHLRALAQAGIVTTERQSRSIIYRLNGAVLRDVISFVAQTCGASSRY